MSFGLKTTVGSLREGEDLILITFVFFELSLYLFSGNAQNVCIDLIDKYWYR